MESKKEQLRVLLDLFKSASQSLDNHDDTKECLRLVKIFKDIITELHANPVLQITRLAMTEEILLLEIYNMELMQGYSLPLHVEMLNLIDEIERCLLRTSN